MPSSLQPMVIPASSRTTRPSPEAGIELPDVDARLDDVRRLGGTVTGGPDDMPWGRRVAHTTDPDGNVVDLTTATT